MTYKLLKIIIFFLLIGFGYSNTHSTAWECESGDYFFNDFPLIPMNNREIDRAVIRAQIWEIHRSDSLFEMNENSIEDGFDNLITTYKEHGILVNISGRTAIYNDTLYYFNSPDYDRPFDLLSSYAIDTVMNFYYLPNINYTDGTLTGYGYAGDIGSNQLFVAGNECSNVGEDIECFDLANTFIPIHELGHCLGLLHTHSTTFGDEHVIRIDDEDIACEVNCEQTGDFLCDTEASLTLKNEVLFDGFSCLYETLETDSCGYIYEPQIDNVMSYTHLECGNYLTTNQTDRMFYYIENNENVIPTIINPGDLNDDSIINVSDIILLVQAILMDEDLSDLNLWLGDLNYDDILNIFDLVIIINIILE